VRLPTWANVPGLTLALALVACRDAPHPTLKIESSGAQTPTRVVQAQAAINVSRRTALVAAADRVSPAVVSINVTSRQQVTPRSPWDFFFVPEGARLVQGYGTGFIIRASGIIVTNQHVVANAERVAVTLPDGSDLPATVLGEDPLARAGLARTHAAAISPRSARTRSANHATPASRRDSGPHR